MDATDKLFSGSIPEIYDRLFVPLIFQPYANDLAERIARTDPENVLETAAGTGVLTRAMVSRLPDKTRIAATDLNQPMLDHAMTKQPQPDRVTAQVTWRQADALALPFQNQEFDVVACQFGAMFFPDKIKGFSEARRVLTPRGHFFFNVWDRIGSNEFADIVTASLASLFPQDPPMFMARTPHGYHDLGRIRDELAAAGFTSIYAETVDHRSKAASPRDVAVAYCQGTPLRTEIETRDASLLEKATEIAADALAHRFGNGPVDGLIRAHVITATN